MFFFLGRIICRCEMQVWPPCRNFSAKTPNIIWLKFKSDKTENFIPKHQIFLELSICTCRMQFWQPCMKLSPNSVYLALEFPKKSKNAALFERFVLSWNDHPLEWNEVFNTVPKFFCKTPNLFWLKFKSDKNSKLFFPTPIFFSIFSFVHVECSFDNRAWSFHTKLRNFDAQILKTVWKIMCFSRELFFFLGRIICRCEMQVWPPCRNFSAKTPNIIWLKFKSDKTVNFIPKHQIFLELSICTCRMQFWQPCMKLSPNSVYLTLVFPKKAKVLLYLRDLFFPGMIFRWSEMKFLTPCPNFSAKLRTYFDWNSKVIKTVNFFSQRQFFSRFFPSYM